jgi:hypothetical protein
MLQNKEQWIITINRKEFVINEVEKSKLEIAMKNGDRWFKTFRGDIISISHIESVVLHSKQIKNQLEAGEKKEELVSDEKWEEFRKKVEKIWKK